MGAIAIEDGSPATGRVCPTPLTHRSRKSAQRERVSEPLIKICTWQGNDQSEVNNSQPEFGGVM